MKATICAWVLIWCFATTGLIAAESREPKISLKEALRNAEKYVLEKKLKTTGLFLATIYRSEFPKNPKRNCWTIIWAPKEQVLDGELQIYVYDDGSIQDGGSA